MNVQLKAGDIVVLKSKGPRMTIQNIEVINNDHLEAECSWFKGEELVKDWFALESLVLSDEK